VVATQTNRQNPRSVTALPYDHHVNAMLTPCQEKRFFYIICIACETFSF
jgi:hypothetical protein